VGNFFAPGFIIEPMLLFKDMRKFRLDFAIILILVGFIFGTRIVRGTPPPIELEPAKVRGNANAPVFIVEFTDFQCPYCRKIQPTLLKILEAFPNDVKIVHKHYPLDFIHSHSRRLAEASECAADQGKYWEYSDLIYDKVMEWGRAEQPKDLEPFLGQYAAKAGLDLVAFQTCLDSGTKKEVVERNKQEGKRLFVSGTPTLLINGKKVLISHDFEKIKKQIQKALGQKSTS
jgi:protein-disulfide isomerase